MGTVGRELDVRLMLFINFGGLITKKDQKQREAKTKLQRSCSTEGLLGGERANMGVCGSRRHWRCHAGRQDSAGVSPRTQRGQ